MIIKQLNLDHFGKFHGREIDLNPGVNIIYGANESGKSTVHAFIQSMLFGAERLRGRGAGRDAYSKYQPEFNQYRPAVGPAGWAVYDQYAVLYGEYGYGSYGQCGCGTGPGLSEG